MIRTKREIERVLRKLGFVLDRTEGPHDVFVRPGHPRPISVPRHSGDLTVGTIRAIWRQAGVTPAEAEKLR